MTRRNFLGTALGAAAASRLDGQAKPSGRPALLGGAPVRREPFPSWPVIGANDAETWKEVLRKGLWCRLDGTYAEQFEEAWARTLGAKYCLATASGTAALFASLNALGIGPGDEVIVPPYTFVATINVVLLQHALPVFVDSDRETFQIDARKIEAAITSRTACILPVHIGGSPADVDTILAVAKKHNLPVVEDACQAHLGEWRRQKLSTWGDLGCFSFQASKNLNSGEGGAIISNSPELIERCRSFHNQGRGTPETAFSYVRNGSNLRMTEFQAALLLEQLTRLESQSRTRAENAAYLTEQLRDVPGMTPARMYEGCTRNAYHLYMILYDKEQFAGLPRSRFLEALRAEGIPCSAGYSPLNKESFLKNALGSRAFRAIYSEKQLGDYQGRIDLPENDKLCDQAVWLTQNMLLGPRRDMDQIVEAVRKIRAQASALAPS